MLYDDPYYIVGTEQAISKITNHVLVELLSKSPQSRIYLIGYLGTNLYYRSKEIRKLDKPNLIHKMFREIEMKLIQNGVDDSRIVKVNGGYKDETRSVEFWFVPKGGEIPKPKPNYFLKKHRKTKANKFN